MTSTTTSYSTIFKVIEDEATKSGLRIKSIFGDVAEYANIVLSNTNATFKFDSNIASTLKNDIAALVKYRQAVINGMDETKAFKVHMQNASVFARNYASSIEDISEVPIQELAEAQRKHAISLQAIDKSLKNSKQLIDEYNSGCATSKLTQTEFIGAIESSNKGLGGYLKSLNGAQASLGGYVGYLAKTAASTLQRMIPAAEQNQ